MGIRYESYGKEGSYASDDARAFDAEVFKYKLNHIKYSTNLDPKSLYFIKTLSNYMGRKLYNYEIEIVKRMGGHIYE